MPEIPNDVPVWIGCGNLCYLPERQPRRCSFHSSPTKAAKMVELRLQNNKMMGLGFRGFGFSFFCGLGFRVWGFGV